ncbi:MAG: DNA adenine methylase [Rhodobacter sp.]|nr:DNA adenine methylase [Rhodobacter sp.]MCA3538779.1 DNA adenine methylase [Rhodobacter sp.]MCA3549470.1 DNA adenine methylase [Rhodobacter sp.]MCA3703391.1 DNA adenine methylase [Methylobacterium sp.]
MAKSTLKPVFWLGAKSLGICMYEKQLQKVDLSHHPKRHGGQAASPFRYPGGKGFLTSFLAGELNRRFSSQKPSFAEPYCGGAGAALNLLVDGLVNHVHLNDADVRVYSAWWAMVNETERFIQAINDTDATIENWEKCLRVLHDTTSETYDFEVGFSAFFINRTSRSGVLLGSGPIGGYNQNGNWKIDAGYYRTSLCKRITKLSELKDSISITNMDGLEFCVSLKQRGILQDTFLFIDPPYMKAGGRLYHDGMTEKKHAALAKWLKEGHAPHWLLTYDDHPVVRENYQEMQDYTLEVRYSLAKRRMEAELLYMS